MNRSLYLLTEGLFELHQLATEARKSKPLLYEGLGYSNFDIVLLEAEDQPGFLTRAADAVKKLSGASKTALVELNELQDGLPDSFVNSKAAIAKAQKELKDMSADTGLSKAWQMMKTVSIKKLYSGDDQPLEKIAEITSDMVRYQQMVAAVIADLNEQIDEISGSLEAGTTADGKSLTDVLGVKPLNMWDEALGDDADFSEARIKKAIATAAKPAKWFSGLKALGGSLGIGFGGDLPFKRYGLNGNKLLEDFMGSNVAAIEAANKIVKVEPDDKKVAQGVGDATEEMGKAAEEQQDAGVGSPDGETSSGGAKPETETGSAPASSGGSAGGTGGGSGGGSNKFLAVLKGVPGIRNPDAAADKLKALLSAGYIPQSNLFTEGLTSLLLEKNVRYNDVIEALKDHLPEEESEIPAALKSLSDEMKVELGSEFGIVGIPDSTSADIKALKDEIQALRAALDTLPDDKRTAAEEQIKDNLVAAGATDTEAADIVNDEVSVEDAAAGVDAEDVDKVESAAEESADAAEDAGVTSWFKEKAGAAWDKTKDKFNNLKDSFSPQDMIILAQAAADPENVEAQKKAAEVMKRVAADQIKGEAGDELGGVINGLAGLDADSPASESGGKKDPQPGEFYEYTTAKGKTAGYKVAAITADGNVQLAQPKKDLTGYTKSVFAVSPGRLGKKLSDEATALALVAKATEEPVKQESFTPSGKDRLAHVAVARMRGYILNETNNFRYASNLTPKQVVQEFYRRGGSNDMVKVKKTQDDHALDRWKLLAGLK